MQKLYLVGRLGLGFGLFCAQVCHAMREFVRYCPESERAWYTDSNNIVVLGVKDEAALLELYSEAGEAGIDRACFMDADIGDGNEVTAIALLDAKALLRKIPLVSERSFSIAA